MYESYWNQDVECWEIINTSWNSVHSKHASLLNKIQAVLYALTKWSRSKFSNNKLRVNDLQLQLKHLTNQQHVFYDLSEAKALKEELHRVWSREEQYWAIRSRLNWLKLGDKNTRFFHATTIQRRQRNRITMLKDDDNY